LFKKSPTRGIFDRFAFFQFRVILWFGKETRVPGDNFGPAMWLGHTDYYTRGIRMMQQEAEANRQSRLTEKRRGLMGLLRLRTEQLREQQEDRCLLAAD
jgi:hypothetical protein